MIRSATRPAALVSFLLTATVVCAEKTVSTFPLPFDASEWTSMLGKYVDARGLVAYGRWKSDATDRKRLSAFLAKFGRLGGASLEPDQKIAILVNAYNAFIIETVLDRYPVESIRAIPSAFTREDHAIGGGSYSLDAIEHTAVKLGGFRVHATMVCASRSCPPLVRRAYEASDLSAREDERMRAWMARGDLYRFEPAKNTVYAPKYFDWYKSDFEKAGIPTVLSTYAPERYRGWLALRRFKIEFLEYDWGLNDAFGGGNISVDNRVLKTRGNHAN
jgi:hypothetical protein